MAGGEACCSCATSIHFVRSIFMLRSRWFLLLAFLANGFVLPAPLQAAEPKVNDQAEFFSKSAIEQATQKMQEIHRISKDVFQVVIDTIPSIPDNMKAPDNPGEMEPFFRRWAETRAADEGVRGIYVLICKNPPHLQIEPDHLLIR